MKDFLTKLNFESKYIKLVENVLNNKNCSCFGLNFNEISFILKMIEKQKILVVPSIEMAFKYSAQLESLGLKTMTLSSKIENYTFSYFESDDAIKNLTLAMFKLCENEIDCLICVGKVLMQNLIDKKTFQNLIVEVCENREIGFEYFRQKLVEMGYKLVQEIENKGEFTVRGDCVSVFPLNLNYPIKISFFDDEVEKISSFSLETYEILSQEKSVKICPISFCFINNSVEEKIFESLNLSLKSASGEKKQNLLSLKSEIENRPSKFMSSNFALPFLNLSSSILSFLDDKVVAFVEPKLIVDEINNEYVEDVSKCTNLICEGRLLSEHKNCVVKKDEVFSNLNTALAFLNLNTSNKIFKSDEVFSFLSSFVKNYNNNFSFLLDDVKGYLNQNNLVILCAETLEKAMKLEKFFKQNEISINIITSLSMIKFDMVNIFVSPILQGVNFVEDKVVILGNQNIYNTLKNIETDKKIKKVFFTPKVGDFVVHDTFGICLCKKIEKIAFNGVEKDYIVLEFSGGDVLYLPSEKTNLISKYVGENENPKLNKLGSDEFSKEKQKVKAKVKDLAFNLIELYAKRNKIKGFKFIEDDIVQKEFENAFPFELTLDQQKATDDIKKDMESERVMDRLVCGDVGYGKTEVAMRAIFKAILSGKQVAFLCPTTILSEQHFKTCLARMSSFMVNVACLNRFKSQKETKEILNNLKEGKIDLICGTHRLLSKDVEFNSLGLLVLDEEQRFGVSDKEKIKNLKQNIDVLTLSATPIPRTLNMSLIGVRDISIIDTPPKNRLPVQSIVTQQSPQLIKDAIQRELSRNGQVLIVHNRVETISAFAKTIGDFFPNVSLAVAHGQMDKKQLENVILKVYNEEIKILISTVLIENGIDLPNANTIIITNADKLGLSQLYQLKGRVGRSNREAFAYFTYENNKSLTEEGYKRLQAISEFNSLGSGFKIAMRDLEIRGAGSIFGAEQSGHIEKVGIDMYNRLLKQAVDELKGKAVSEVKDLKLDVQLDCFIPKNYIMNEEKRLDEYAEISTLNTLKILDEHLKFLEKKYGEVPNQVLNLCFISLLKNLLQNFGAKRFVLNGNSCYAEFYDKKDVDNDEMLKILSKNKRNLSLKFKALPIIEFSLNGDNQSKIKQIINILTNL